MNRLMHLFAIWLLIALASNAIPSKPNCNLKCSDGTQISSHWRCDNIRDCTDGSDEMNCKYLHACLPNYFICTSMDCVPPEQKCNGVKDCLDGSDELGCDCRDKDDAVENKRLSFIWTVVILFLLVLVLFLYLWPDFY